MRTASLRERRGAYHGLGYADPWSDRRIASFVLAIPQTVVQSVQEPKQLAKRAMQGMMPEQVRQPYQKVTPQVLYEEGLKQARDVVLDLITRSQAAARGYVDEKALHRHYEALVRHDYKYDLWWPLTLEMWMRQYL